MKLLIILSVIACSYADKLDRTYLPPASAATAGGSPGSIAAPGTESELGLPKDTSPFNKPSVSSISQTPDFTFGQVSKPGGSQFIPQFGQPGAGLFGSQTSPQSGSPQFGQPESIPNNSQYQLTGLQSASSQFGQPGASPVGSQYQQTGPQLGSPQFGQSGSGPTGSQAGLQSGSSQLGQPGIGPSDFQTSPQSGSPQIGQTGSGPFDFQIGSQSGLSQVGQFGSGPFGSQAGPQYGLPGSGPSVSQVGPQFGRPGSSPFSSQAGYQSGSPQFAQPGVSSQSGLPQFGQPDTRPLGSQYNSASPSSDSGRPEFGQANAGFNKSPAVGDQGQGFPALSRPSLPERARASLDRNAEILHYQNDIDGDSFAYNFETSNGIAADEAGTATNGVRAKGGFSYTGDDGQIYSVRYTADENGYIPQGDHLPTPHPIPEEILKSLEENAKAAASGTQEGAYNPEEDAYSSFGEPNRDTDRYKAGQNPSSQYDFPGTTTATARPQVGTSPRPQFGLGAGTIQYGNSEPSSSSSTQPGSSRFPSAGNQVRGPVYDSPGALSSNLKPGSTSGQSPTSQYNNLAPLSGSSQNPKSPAFGDVSSLSSPGTGRPGAVSLSPQGIGASYPERAPSFGYPLGKPGLPNRTNQSPPSQLSNQANPSIGSNGLSSSDSVPSQNGQNSRTQYGRPGNAGLPRPGIPSFESKYQPITSSLYPSSSAKPLSPGFSSQENSYPTSQYKMPLSSYPNTDRPFGSISGANQGGFSRPRFPSQNYPNFGYQYNSPDSKTGSQRPLTQIGNSPSSQFGTTASSPLGPNPMSGPKDFITFGTPTGPKPSETSETSQYPTGVSPFGPTSVGVQRLPTQESLSPGSPNSNGHLKPQHFRPGKPNDSEVSTTYDNQAATGLSNEPTGIGSSKPTISQNLPGITSQSSPTQFPTISPSSLGEKPGYYQRPQYGSIAASRPTGSNILGSKGQATQDQDESGYKYSRPQTTYTGSSQPVDQGTSFGNNLSQRPPTSSTSSTNLTPIAPGFPWFPGSANQRYPSNLGPSSLSPDSSSQSIPFSRPGQYAPGNLNSRPTSSIFSRPGNTVGSLGTSSNIDQLGSNPNRFGSAPYQYNRPVSQDTQVTSSTMPSFEPSGLKRPGQVGSLNPLEKKMPEQVATQPDVSKPSFGPIGQGTLDKVEYEPGFGLVGQGKPGSGISKPGPILSEQGKPSQESSQPGFERPGKLESRPGYNLPEKKRPTQAESLSTFEPSRQDRPGLGNVHPDLDIPASDRPGQNGKFGQKIPGQIGSQNVYGPSRQDRPDKTGIRPVQNRPGQRGQEEPKEDFSGPRQPPSFSKEEGYKY